MNTEVLVRGDELGHTFRQGGMEIPALNAASFEIKARDRIAIVGPSGSGKSSLMHLIAGLDSPTSGAVSWPGLGARESLLPANIGFIAQAQSLVTSLDVLENIELPLLFLGRPEAEARDAAMEILISFGLGEIADKLPSELSGGQMKRAASARALVAKPRLVLADEPTGQLDHVTAKRFLEVLFSWIDAGDTALVMTTHDPEVARYMKALWSMDHGALKAVST